MSLDKAITHGKEHRKPYRGSKAFDPSCRTKRCPYCRGNKTHAINKKILSACDIDLSQLQPDTNLE
jgi:hypothetical protein